MNESPYLGRFVQTTDVYIPSVAREVILCSACGNDIIAGGAYTMHVVRPMAVRSLCKDCAQKAEKRNK